jgi:uncharacterized protein (TIGR02246 family)
VKNIMTVVAMVFFFGFACAQKQDSIAITKVIENFISALNQRDIKLYVSLFSEDADFYNWQGSYAHGRQQIEDFHVAAFKTWATRWASIELKVISYSIRFLKPDIAVVIVKEKNTDMTSLDGKPLPDRLVDLVWVLTKENSGWLIKMNHTAMLDDGSKAGTKN